jgi:hypothetical protein
VDGARVTLIDASACHPRPEEDSNCCLHAHRHL